MIYWLLFSHFIADFVCQTRWMGENKSKDWEAMFSHIYVYTFVLLVLCSFIMPAGLTVKFAFFNGLAHLLTDLITSRLTSRFYQNKQMHLFWCTIGFDQFLHTSVLLLTYQIFIY